MIYVGDCLTILPKLDADSIDAIVTDPPYGLGFMGKDWDHGVPGEHFWREAMRVAKPGAYLLAFGGTRTFHRLTCAIEDAGWEIRDTIMWVYGSGFPKSHNLDGEREGWGTALKPAWEPIILARRPFRDTVARNVAKYGTGALNIAGCRVETTDDLNGGAYAANGGEFVQPAGRWPANLIHDGSEEVVACFPDAPGQIADASRSSSSRKIQNVYGAMTRGNGRDGEASADRRYADKGGTSFTMTPGTRRLDAGSAARFFYCAKASRKDRNEGCEHIEPAKVHGPSGDGRCWDIPGSKSTPRSNNHPTVKPTELMRYLCRLVTPPGGLVLDPFAGSGSTGKAAALEGLRFLGVELSADYAAIAEARIRAVMPANDNEPQP